MELFQLTNNIYYTSYEEERDRPILGYIKGKDFSVAIDAGHSKQHVEEFYSLLKQYNLELPKYTIITHWHWDHSFGIHAIHGQAIASNVTNQHIKDFIANRSQKTDEEFLHLDPSITKEYEKQELIVVPAQIEFEDKHKLNNGTCSIQMFHSISPHTDDATLIYIPDEKVIFIGDALSGVFPTWIADHELSVAFANVLEQYDFEYCIGGHWPIQNKQEVIETLINQ